MLATILLMVSVAPPQAPCPPQAPLVVEVDPYATAYARAMREGKRLIVGVAMDPPNLDGIRIRVETFKGIEKGYVVGEPSPDGGMIRRDYPVADHIASAGKMITQAACTTGG